jgi:O-antigen ligase
VLGRDPLGVAILFWILTGAARLGFDLRDYGWLALRDYATYYYAAFFFVARALARNPDSVRILRGSVTFALAVLPLLYLLANTFDEFFLTGLLVRGIPVFYYKEDLVAAYLFAGYFFLLAPPRPGGMAWRVPVAAVCFVTAFTIGSSRAAIVALVVTSGWWLAARRWQPLKLQAALAAAGLAVLALVAVAGEKPFNQSRLYTLYEHLASMIDLPGTGNYESEGRQYVGDNNRFRLVWWEAVATETWETNPVLGMGFGYDLAARFQSTYEQDLGDEFTTRSPHSILFTLLGRTGLLGLAGFAVIVAGMVRKTLRVVRAIRTDPAALGPLGWWSVCWTILISACFGVVLEGPMGAVIFWTLLGLAVAEETRPAPDEAATVAHLPGAAGAAGVGPTS